MLKRIILDLQTFYQPSERMKRVCIFTVFNRNENNPGYKHAELLSENGYDVTLVFADNLPDEIKNGILITSIEVSYSIGDYRDRLFRFPRLFWKKLCKIDADIYETSDVDLLIICLKLKKRGKRVVFHLLEEHPFTLYSKLSINRSIISVIIKLVIVLMRYILRKVDKVFTVAPDIKDYLTKWGINDVSILGNYPKIDFKYKLSLEEYLSRPSRIIYFGAIYSISRQEVFFDALAKCNDVSYLLAGDFGIGTYRNQLERHPYWAKVEFIGKFPRNDLPVLLSRCTISNVLRDFSQTGYPQGSYGIIKLYESMEAGLPIICADVPVYQELMAEYKCGILVDPNNSEQILDAILFLVNNKNAAYEMGQEGRRAVVEKYNFTLEGKKYLSFLSAL